MPQGRRLDSHLLPVEISLWRNGSSDLKSVQELEAKNAKLKRMYAELAPENRAMKGLIAKKL